MLRRRPVAEIDTIRKQRPYLAGAKTAKDPDRHQSPPPFRSCEHRLDFHLAGHIDTDPQWRVSPLVVNTHGQRDVLRDETAPLRFRGDALESRSCHRSTMPGKPGATSNADANARASGWGWLCRPVRIKAGRSGATPLLPKSDDSMRQRDEMMATMTKRRAGGAHSYANVAAAAGAAVPLHRGHTASRFAARRPLSAEGQRADRRIGGTVFDARPGRRERACDGIQCRSLAL